MTRSDIEASSKDPRIHPLSMGAASMKHHRVFSTSIGLVGFIAVLVMLVIGGRDSVIGREATFQPNAAEPARPTMSFATPTRIPGPAAGERGWPNAVVLGVDGSISLEFDALPTAGRAMPGRVALVSIDDDGSRYAGLIVRNTTGKSQLSIDTPGICAVVLEDDGSWTIERVLSGIETSHGTIPPTYKAKTPNLTIEVVSRLRFKEVSTAQSTSAVCLASPWTAGAALPTGPDSASIRRIASSAHRRASGCTLTRLTTFPAARLSKTQHRCS